MLHPPNKPTREVELCSAMGPPPGHSLHGGAQVVIWLDCPMNIHNLHKVIFNVVIHIYTIHIYEYMYTPFKYRLT